MKRFMISTAAVVLSLTVAASAQAKGPSCSGGKGGKTSGGPSNSTQVASNHTSNNHNSPNHTNKTGKDMKKDFQKGNDKFKDKDFCKHFTHKYWCSDFGCYCYWCPMSSCYYFWYEPYACYCPYEYIQCAYPTVVAQPVVEVVETVTTITTTTPVVKTTSYAKVGPTPPPPPSGPMPISAP